MLLFLLAINQLLLSPPTIKDDVGDQLCERVLSVLFEVWLLACVKCFPSPSLWKTFQESCAAWRHRIALVEQWNRVNLALTAKLLEFTYGSSFPELKIRKFIMHIMKKNLRLTLFTAEEDQQLIPSTMSNDCVAQSWYRFIRVIGSPIALCCPQVISHTPAFMQYILLRDDSIDPHQHPCLQILPQIFLKAMKGIACEVDAFLGKKLILHSRFFISHPSLYQIINLEHCTSSNKGIFQPIKWEEGIIIDNTLSTTNSQSNNPSGISQRSGSGLSRSGAETNSSSSTSSNSNSVIGVGSRNLVLTASVDTNVISEQSSPTQPLQRRLAKSFSVAPSHSHTKGCDNNSIISKSYYFSLAQLAILINAHVTYHILFIVLEFTIVLFLSHYSQFSHSKFSKFHNFSFSQVLN